MAALSLIMKVLCVAVVCMAVLGAPVVEAVSCGQVTSSLLPCVTYLQKGGTPPTACCDGVKSLVSTAQTTADKQAMCNCLKAAAREIPGLNYKNAETMPSQCNVNVPYKISPSTDCNTIKF